MKKFLSVLLALAVAFTFTFGSAMSAFAATATDDSSSTQAELYAAKKLELEGTYKAALEKLSANYTESTASVTDIVVPKAVYTEIAKVVYNDYMDVLAIAYSKGDISTETNINDGAARNGMKYGDVDNVDKFVALVTANDSATAYKDATLIANLDNYKTYITGEIGKIDTGLYTNDVMIDEDPYQMTYKAFAEKIKGDKLNDVGKVTLNKYSTTAQINEAYYTLNALLTGLTEKTGYTDAKGKRIVLTYKVSGTYTVNEKSQQLLTEEELKLEDAQDNATKNALKAEVLTNANTYYSDAVTKTDYASPEARDTAIAAAKKAADAYTEVMNCRIDEGVVVSSPITALSADNATTFTTAVEDYAKLVAEANELKVAVDAAGNLLWNAAKIDENLAKGKIAIYTTEARTYTLTTGAAAKGVDLAWEKEKKIAAVESERDYGTVNGYVGFYQADGTTNYYEPEMAKINEIYNKVIDKINAATSYEQLLTISTAVYSNNSSNPVFAKTKTQVETDITNLSKFEGEKTKLDAYAAYVNGDTKSWADGYKAPFTDDELAAFYAENGARTNDEIIALTADAKAAFDARKTNKEIADAKKAVEDMITALPAYITLADKDAVKAAYNALVELDMDVDNSGKLDNAINQLKSLEVKAMDTALKGLPAKITVADKAAINALVAARDAYEAEPMYKEDGQFAPYLQDEAVDKAFEALREAERVNVMNAIAALSEASTKEQVEAARAAYDAFVAEYQDAEEPYNAKDSITNLDKLTVLEATLAPSYDDQDAKADLLDMSRKLTIWRTSKTSIKVTAVGSVKNIKDNGYTVQYKFYKKAPGAASYKLVKTTSSNKYTYTNLKKGTNKFQVKVVVKDADGKIVATKMTYYRAAKIK